MSHRSLRRGTVLFVSLGMLVVLAIFAVAFARLTSIERDVAARHSIHTQARFVADAGIEAGMSQLAKDYSTILVDSETTPWTYEDGESPEIPIEYSTLPSYRAGTITIGGRSYGYSGIVNSPPRLPIAVPDGSHYVLKIVDGSGYFNLNDENPNLAQILDNLGEAITDYTGNVNPVNGRGNQIMNFRTTLGGKFKATSDLAKLPGFTTQEIDLLMKYVTVHGWQDRVLVPKPHGGSTTDAIDLAYQTALRTPVNVNTAPEPVLSALFRGIRARCLFPAAGTYTFASSVAITETEASKITDEIIKRRKLGKPILSLYDLADLLEKELKGPFLGYMPIVMASLNPNAHLTKFNSDWCYNVYGLDKGPNGQIVICDKADLQFYTTEVTFASAGFFEITSLGRLVDEDRNDIIAAYKIQQTVKTFDVMRHSTQRDFEKNVVGTPYRSRSYPENMPDQRDSGQPINPDRASALDGQIVLDDRETNRAGSTWWCDSDTKFQHYSEMNGRWSPMRWPSGVRHQGQNPKCADLRHYQPIYSAEGAAGTPQNPFERSLLNESLASGFRTTSYKSDLHPDGFWFNQFNNTGDSRFREQEFDAVDGYGYKSSNWFERQYGNAIYYPNIGRAEYWIKPDTRFRKPDEATQALLRLYIFDNNAPAPWSGWGWGPANHMLGIMYYQGNWIFYNTQRSGCAGTVSSLLRRPLDWSYPLDDYVYSDYWRISGPLPNVSNSLEPMQWNHVRAEWYYFDMPWRWMGHTYYYYYAIRLWINGNVVLDRSGYEYYSWVYGYYMITPGENQTGRMQFPYFDMNPMVDAGWPTGRNTCTVDQLRMSRWWWGGSYVNHYNPTNGWSYWKGRFTFPENVRVHSIRYTEYPGVPTKGAVAKKECYTQLEWKVGTSTARTPANPSGTSQAPADDVNLDGTSLDYTIYFYDNGQRPITQTPFVDDVTVYYSSDGGLTVVDRMEGF